MLQLYEVVGTNDVFLACPLGWALFIPETRWNCVIYAKTSGGQVLGGEVDLVFIVFDMFCEHMLN